MALVQRTTSSSNQQTSTVRSRARAESRHKLILSKASKLKGTQNCPINQDAAQSIVRSIPNVESLSSEKLVVGLQVNLKSELPSVQHVRGGNGGRTIYILALGGSHFVLDSNRNSKTGITVWRPFRIFAWVWDGHWFFSITGPRRDAPACFWVLCEDHTINDMARRRSFNDRNEALNFTLGMWEEYVAKTPRCKPQSNEVFLDSFESLFTLELSGCNPLAVAQRLSSQLAGLQLEEAANFNVIELFASKCNQSLFNFVAKMKDGETFNQTEPEIIFAHDNVQEGFSSDFYFDEATLRYDFELPKLDVKQTDSKSIIDSDDDYAWDVLDGLFEDAFNQDDLETLQFVHLLGTDAQEIGEVQSTPKAKRQKVDSDQSIPKSANLSVDPGKLKNFMDMHISLSDYPAPNGSVNETTTHEEKQVMDDARKTLANMDRLFSGHCVGPNDPSHASFL